MFIGTQKSGKKWKTFSKQIKINHNDMIITRHLMS